MLMMLALAVATPVDYRADASWLCRPGRTDVCAGDLDETVVTAAGAMTRRAAPRARPQDVDCFYVYPTVSLDPGGNSDMTANRDEQGMTTAQFAPFRSVCRPFAPLYRQVTLTALRKTFAGAPFEGSFELAYGDVRAAFRDYLTRDNGGRPFVLVGQSQGASLLKRLIAEEIDGQPLQARMVSAILPGSSVLVPAGQAMGGTFKAVPLCERAAQAGCVVTWATYRAGTALPAHARFGTAVDGIGTPPQPGMEAGCTNPAALGGGRVPLKPILGFQWWKGGVGQYERPKQGWAVGTRPIATRFAAMPGLLTGECVRAGPVHYLSVDVAAKAAQPVADTVVGTGAVGDGDWPDWGFHVIDMAVVEGDLLALVPRQAAAWRAQRK